MIAWLRRLFVCRRGHDFMWTTERHTDGRPDRRQLVCRRCLTTTPGWGDVIPFEKRA